MSPPASKNCIICGADSAVSILEEVPGYAILFCQGCRLRFSNPMTHPGQAFYEESHLYGNRDINSVSLSLPKLEWRYRTFLREAPPRPGNKLLDLGCGDGGILEWIAEMGVEPFGLELDVRAVEIARQIRGLKNVEQGPFEKSVELGWKDFDCVTCMEVMEHVPNPVELARHIRSLLRPGGVAAISVPNWDRRPPWFDPDTDYPPHHFTLWTRQALEKLLREAGFEHIRVFESPIMIQNLLYIALSRLKKKRGRTDAPGPTHPGRAASEIAASASTPPVINLNRRRVAVKKALYTAFNLINPVFRAIPMLHGYTLLAIAKKTSA